jgi:hypothetical protein
VTFVEVQDIRDNPQAFKKFVDAFGKNSLLQEAMCPAMTRMRAVVGVEDIKHFRAIEDIKGCSSAAYAICIYMVLLLSCGVIFIPAPHIELQWLSGLIEDVFRCLVFIGNIFILNMLAAGPDCLDQPFAVKGHTAKSPVHAYRTKAFELIAKVYSQTTSGICFAGIAFELGYAAFHGESGQNPVFQFRCVLVYPSGL